MMTRKSTFGFSLIELMIAVAIVAILGAVAYPSYLSHVQSVRREEAKRTLVEAAQHMEAFYAMNLSYSGSVSSAYPTGFGTSDDFDSYYTLSATLPTGNSYTLTATPKGAQSSDSCSALSLNSTGQTSPNSGGCW